MNINYAYIKKWLTKNNIILKPSFTEEIRKYADLYIKNAM